MYTTFSWEVSKGNCTSEFPEKIFFKYLFEKKSVYLGLCWVIAAVLRLSLSVIGGRSLQRLPLVAEHGFLGQGPGWVAVVSRLSCPWHMGCSRTRGGTHVPCIVIPRHLPPGRFFTNKPPGKFQEAFKTQSRDAWGPLTKFSDSGALGATTIPLLSRCLLTSHLCLLTFELESNQI